MFSGGGFMFDKEIKAVFEALMVLKGFVKVYFSGFVRQNHFIKYFLKS